MTPVLLVAHGSSYPRAAATHPAQARAVAAARPGLDVRTAYLDHRGPRPGEVLVAWQAAGVPSVAVVPLLLTSAYHGRVDLPEVLGSARAAGLTLDPVCSDVLGPVDGVVPPLLLAALRRRLAAALASTAAARAIDAVVLAAAGTRDEAARATVDLVAARLGDALGVPTQVAYASGAGPTGGEAVRALYRRGASRVAVAAYFLACGRLYDAVTGTARAAGAVAVAAPLGDAWELARHVLSRVDAVDPAPVALTAAA